MLPGARALWRVKEELMMPVGSRDLIHSYMLESRKMISNRGKQTRGHGDMARDEVVGVKGEKGSGLSPPS